MIRQLLALVTLALFWCAGEQQRKPQAAVLSVVQFQARRDGDKVLLDGRIKNESTAEIKDAELYFNFLGADRRGVASRHTELESDGLEAGDETEIRMATSYPEGAVTVKLEVKDRKGKPLELANPGPYPIE